MAEARRLACAIGLLLRDVAAATRDASTEAVLDAVRLSGGDGYVYPPELQPGESLGQTQYGVRLKGFPAGGWAWQLDDAARAISALHCDKGDESHTCVLLGMYTLKFTGALLYAGIARLARADGVPSAPPKKLNGVVKRAMGVHDEPDEPDERKRQCTSKGVRRALDFGGELTEASAPEPMMSGAGNDPVLDLDADAARCERALGAMLRGVTQLLDGRACVAGSYALHHYLSHVELQPPPWAPGDIDVFFAVPDGADAVELRHRVEAMARCCQAELGVDASSQVVVRQAGAYLGGVVDGKGVAEHAAEGDARLANYIRSSLLTLCTREPPRARGCVRPPRQRPRPCATSCSPRAHRLPPAPRLVRYRVCSSTKVVLRDGQRWPPAFNLVEVAPTAACDAAIASGVGFAELVLKDFDLVPAQVACVIDGSEPPRLVTVLTDAARTAVRNGELQLTGCAFGSGAGVRATVAQLARIVKYVGRGFRLPAGLLAPMPSTAREEAVARAPRQRGHPGRRLRRLCNQLLAGRLGWEPCTPPRAAPPPRAPPSPLRLGLATARAPPAAARQPMDIEALPASATAASDADATAAARLPAALRGHAEARAVWLHVREAVDTAYRTDSDLRRSAVPRLGGWRVLCQMRRTGKGVQRVDMHVYAPWVLPHVTLEALRPTNQAVRSFAALKRLLVGRFAAATGPTSASPGDVASVREQLWPVTDQGGQRVRQKRGGDRAAAILRVSEPVARRDEAARRLDVMGALVAQSALMIAAAWESSAGAGRGAQIGEDSAEGIDAKRPRRGWPARPIRVYSFDDGAPESMMSAAGDAQPRGSVDHVAARCAKGA